MNKRLIFQQEIKAHTSLPFHPPLVLVFWSLPKALKHLPPPPEPEGTLHPFLTGTVSCMLDPVTLKGTGPPWSCPTPSNRILPAFLLPSLKNSACVSGTVLCCLLGVRGGSICKCSVLLWVCGVMIKVGLSYMADCCLFPHRLICRAFLLKDISSRERRQLWINSM